MAASLSSPALPSTANKDTKPHACNACVQRKVRCDKHQPCLSCLRSRLRCNYRTTPPPQRRKRKIENPNQALLDRLRAHEATLRNAGLPYETFEDSNEGVDNDDDGGGETTENSRGPSLPVGPIENLVVTKQPSLPRRGILVSEYGGRRYYEYGLIGALGQEYRQSPINAVEHHGLGDTAHAGAYGSQQETSDILASSVLTGSTQAGLQHQHPPPAAIVKYWSTFLDNVHPLMKIVYAPDVQHIMLGVTLDTPKNTDALRYSIYACAVASLTERECQRVFGESQAPLLHAFQSATRDTLLEHSFLSVPDLDLLRAHVLLLTSMLHTSDFASLWIQMGSAIRIAQSQGLHRDGAALGLSPFDTEMRRRLWWYIVTLDGRLTELMGSESLLPMSIDTLMPSNINDCDLAPDMTTPPQERVGASEMTFCLVKYEFARFLQERDPRSEGSELRLSSRTGQQGEQRSVSDLESFLEEKFLRFCDPVIAVQFLTTTIARSTLYDARTMSSEQSNRTLNTAARNVEYDNLIHSSRSLRGFLWHVKFHFPWGAPIFILKILASRSDWDDDMLAAWAQIEELYEHHPEYMNTDKVQYLIVAGLTLKAWAAREAFLNSKSVWEQRTPAVIVALRSRQAAFRLRHNDSRMGLSRVASGEINFADMGGFDTFNTANFDVMDPILADVDWSNWGGY